MHWFLLVAAATLAASAVPACNTTSGTDFVNTQRCSQYPLGLKTATLGACCDACTAAPDCAGFVFDAGDSQTAPSARWRERCAPDVDVLMQIILGAHGASQDIRGRRGRA